MLASQCKEPSYCPGCATNSLCGVIVVQMVDCGVIEVREHVFSFSASPARDTGPGSELALN